MEKPNLLHASVSRPYFAGKSLCGNNREYVDAVLPDGSVQRRIIYGGAKRTVNPNKVTCEACRVLLLSEAYARAIVIKGYNHGSDAMDDAFSTVFGRHCNGDDERDASLWNNVHDLFSGKGGA